MTNKISAGIVLLLAMVLCGCKINSAAVQRSVSLPTVFAEGVRDTLNTSASVTWKDFFDDSDLVALIDTALANNLDLKMAVQRIQIARTHVRVSNGMLLPSLNVVTTAGQRKFGDYTMDGIGNFDTNFSDNVGSDKYIAKHLPDYYAGLQSAWEIDVWAKLRNQRKAALSRFLATEKGKHLITTQLVSEVAHAYYLLLTLDNELEIIRQNILLQETAVELIQAQKAAGRANQLGVKQLMAQLLNTKSMEAGVRQEIVQRENYLNVVLGRFPQSIKRGSPILKQSLPQEISAGIPSDLLLRRPDIQQAEFDLLASKANVAAARAAFYPQLTLTSAVGFQSFNTAMLFTSPASIAYSVFGGLTTPLFNRNTVRAGYQQAAALQSEQFYSYHKTVLTAFAEVVTNMKRIDNLKVVSGLKEEEVKALQEAVAASKDLFVAGMASYLEVVSAQKNVLEAELGLSVTRKEQFDSVIDLYRALGGGW